MNKQLLSALVALVLVSSVVLANDDGTDPMDLDQDVETQFALFENDSIETSLLSPERLVFREFCIEARDDAQAYLKEVASNMLRSVFFILTEPFEWPEEMEGEEKQVAGALEDNSEALSTEVKEALDKTDRGAVAEPGQQSRFAQLASHFKGAATRAFYIALDAVSKEATRRLQRLRSKFDSEEIKQVVDEACENLNSDLKRNLTQRLNTYKKEIKNSSGYKSTSYDLKNIVDRTSFDNVNCLTTKRLMLLSKFCVVLPTLLTFVDI